MLSLSTSYRTTRQNSDVDSESLPPTPEPGQQDSVFPLEEESEDPLTRSLQLSSPKDSPCHGNQQTPTKVHSLSSSLSMWKMPDSLEECAPMDSGRDSDHESDTESTISSISARSSSKESESSSSSGGGVSSEESPTSAVKLRGGQKEGRLSPELSGSSQQEMLRADPGYCTLPHPSRNGGGKTSRKGKVPAAFKRISTIANSKKRKSVSADISSPSPSHTSTTAQDSASWSGRRQNAIRRTKLSSSFGRSDHIQPIIHESSYTFQIQLVTVIFKGSLKMDIACRGESACAA